MISQNKILVIIITAFSFSALKSQVKKLNDEAIVSQHKRQVYERWGDWRPYGKYVLGVQTNFAYATIWGWLSPQINQDYKDGPDVRPLKATGTEVQRLIAVEQQRQQAEQIAVEVDSIHKRNVQDFAHWTPATVEADPLWLLYYKRMLNPLNNFPNQPKSHTEWGFDDEKIYNLMVQFGEIDKLQERLDLLKEKYNQSRTLAMPRGKRFLMYHDALIEWRKLMQSIEAHNKKKTLILDYKNILARFKNSLHKKSILKSDSEIVMKVMEEYKHRF